MKKAVFYDTTLRDGMQGENIFFSIEDKLRIARRLDEAGIQYIEGGWPGSNPGAQSFFEEIKHVKLKNARIAAFGSTRRPDKTCEEDANIRALIKSEAPVVTIFGKTWDLHVESIMQNTKDENLAMIKDSVTYLLGHGREVIYDAEHFFDGYKANPEYAVKTLEAAVKGGADCLVLCDTNGGSMPCEIETATRAMVEHFKDHPQVIFGIHTHNDCAMAVANSVTAVHAGAVMVQGTINGYGERCGNADLTAIIPILSLKMNCDCISSQNLEKLLNLSRFISETANVPPNNSQPFVGRSAFAHKGGVHVSAIMKNPKAYEHMAPELVGNKRRVIVSEQSGKSNIEFKAKELGVNLGENGVNGHQIVSSIKDLEDYGYEFDAAEGSLKLIMEKLTDQFKPRFELESFRVVVEKDKEHPCYSHAMIKIRVGNTTEITSAEGDGPVSALDNALRKALATIYPQINTMHLVDFKVRVIDGKDGTAAKVRVLIESRDENGIFSTIGVSEDIIEASWQALADSFQYKLSLDNQHKAV
ncbi:MAG: citramalate synthase [Desulfobacterales bacterium RIFOXYA12_FULL_46_15]|nr:MAG: citramalate synthase [Desulfobacterales bacterium RIFOXYA12_FULL_46_15]